MYAIILFTAAVLFGVPVAPATAAEPLAGLRDRARPVVVFADNIHDARFQKQMAALEGRGRILADYDIKVVPFVTGDVALRARLGAPAHGFAVVLVGKDGSVKETWREPVDPQRILALIDAMPMRRDEVRRR